MGCPLTSIFQQWTAQRQGQQQANTNPESKPPLGPNSYRILLQTSYSLQSRISAAEPVENPHVYKRAGVATPSERANRDIYGGGETAWLLHLVELALQQQLSSSDVSPSDSATIILVTTKAGSQDYSMVQELSQDARGKVQVVDIVSRDPFGWDADCEKSTENDNATSCCTDINSLPDIYRILREEFRRNNASGRKTILVWQSLTPLVVVHGFTKILRLLCALPTCLQVWPISMQVLAPNEHAQIEDASNAILQMHGGEMNLIRQGIRERGNIIRQKLSFRLEAIVGDREQHCRFCLVEEAQAEEGEGNDDDIDQGAVKAAGSNNFDERNNNTPTGTDKTGSTKSKARGAQLRIEENDGGRSDNAVGSVSSEQESAAPSRPRIYLQEDDPEFDDFDEEDPDDDLDI